MRVRSVVGLNPTLPAVGVRESSIRAPATRVIHDFVSSSHRLARCHRTRTPTRPSVVRDHGRSACDGGPMAARRVALDQPPLLIKPERLFDATGTTFGADRVVLVQQGRIGAVGTTVEVECQAPLDAERIELPGAVRLTPIPPSGPFYSIRAAMMRSPAFVDSLVDDRNARDKPVVVAHRPKKIANLPSGTIPRPSSMPPTARTIASVVHHSQVGIDARLSTIDVAKSVTAASRLTGKLSNPTAPDKRSTSQASCGASRASSTDAKISAPYSTSRTAIAKTPLEAARPRPCLLPTSDSKALPKINRSPAATTSMVAPSLSSASLEMITEEKSAWEGGASPPRAKNLILPATNHTTKNAGPPSKAARRHRE